MRKLFRSLNSETLVVMTREGLYISKSRWASSASLDGISVATHAIVIPCSDEIDFSLFASKGESEMD